MNALAKRNEIRSRDPQDTFPEEVRRELERLEDEIGTQRARTDSGSSSPTTINQVSGATAGSVIFGGTTGVLTQDNANFFWDDTLNRLGIGNAAPTTDLDVTGTANATTVTGANVTTGEDPGHTHTAASLPTGFTKAIETVTAASDTLDADNYTVLCDCTSNAITINLPAAASSTGQVYHVKKTDSTSNAVTIDPNGAETVDDGTTAVINSQYECLTIMCDGTEWWIL